MSGKARVDEMAKVGGSQVLSIGLGLSSGKSHTASHNSKSEHLACLAGKKRNPH